jgi:hypothetical protein
VQYVRKAQQQLILFLLHQLGNRMPVHRATISAISSSVTSSLSSTF